MALGQGAQASGHEIGLDSLADLGHPSLALLSSLENEGKTQPSSLTDCEEGPRGIYISKAYELSCIDGCFTHSDTICLHPVPR